MHFEHDQEFFSDATNKTAYTNIKCPQLNYEYE